MENEGQVFQFFDLDRGYFYKLFYSKKSGDIFLLQGYFFVFMIVTISWELLCKFHWNKKKFILRI